MTDTPQPAPRLHGCCRGGHDAARPYRPGTYHPYAEPQCLDCAEKHLGSAWVIHAESFDGYPLGAKFVGHLALAAEHCVRWPELHSAIREAYKGWQLRKAVPDWPALGDLLNKAKNQQGGQHAAQPPDA